MFDKIEAVIFDLDGTLADSMGIWRQIDIEYLGKFGIALPAGLQNEIEGMGFTETAYYFKERFQLTDSIDTIKADWNTMIWDKYMYEIALKPGAEEFVKKCFEKGLKLGIATSNSRELVEGFAKARRLDGYFSAIITSCDVKKGKPSPDVYLLAASELGVNPVNCLVFEDIVMGIMAGKAAGMKVCAIEDAYSAYQRTKKAELADYYIDDYYDVLEGEAI